MPLMGPLKVKIRLIDLDIGNILFGAKCNSKLEPKLLKISDKRNKDSQKTNQKTTGNPIKWIICFSPVY